MISGAGGGPDKTVLNSPRYLRQHGYESECLFLRKPNDAPFQHVRERAEKWKAAIHEVDDHGPFDWGLIKRSLEVCARTKATVWHAHDYKTNLLGLILRRWHPLTLVTTAHGWVERTWRTFLYHNLDRISLPFYRKVICVSTDLYEATRSFGIPESQLSLIDNAVDTEQFRRTQSVGEAKSRLNWPTERKLVLAAGRLSPEKGFDVLIQAVTTVVREGVDVGLMIAGDGPELASLERLTKSLGIEDRCKLLGFQSQLIPWYEACDIFALSSLREGLPNVLLEAMAVGAPVLSTKVAGIPRLLIHEDNGLLVEPGRVEDIAESIKRMLHDDALRRSLGENATRTIVERFSFDARMKKVVDVYRSIGVNGETEPS